MWAGLPIHSHLEKNKKNSSVKFLQYKKPLSSLLSKHFVKLSHLYISIFSDTKWWKFILLSLITSVSCPSFLSLSALLMSSGWWARVETVQLSTPSWPQFSSSMWRKQAASRSLTLPFSPWRSLLSWCTLEGIFYMIIRPSIHFLNPSFISIDYNS